MADLNENVLVARAQNGDGEAFDTLMNIYLKRIYGLCYGMTGNQQDAEDCTQDAFLKAYRSLHLYQAKSSFYTWVYRIAVNVCLDSQRSRNRRPTSSLDQTFGEDEQVLQISDHSPLPDELAISHELGSALREQIALLNEPMRDVLILRDLEGLAYDEIARLLHLSEGTVKSRLFRARSQVMRGMRSNTQDPEQIRASQRPKSKRGTSL